MSTEWTLNRSSSDTGRSQGRLMAASNAATPLTASASRWCGPSGQRLALSSALARRRAGGRMPSMVLDAALSALRISHSALATL